MKKRRVALFLHCFVDAGGELQFDGRFAESDGRLQLHGRHVVEGPRTLQDLPEHHTEGPVVHRVVEALPAQDLGRRVVRRAQRPLAGGRYAALGAVQRT